MKESTPPGVARAYDLMAKQAIVVDDRGNYLHLGRADAEVLVNVLNAADLIRRNGPRTVTVNDWLRDRAQCPNLRVCPGCGLELSTVGLPSIAYTFETMGDQLGEQLWHRDCLVDSQDDPDVDR